MVREDTNQGTRGEMVREDRTTGKAQEWFVKIRTTGKETAMVREDTNHVLTPVSSP